jgi:hypothetical protein
MAGVCLGASHHRLHSDAAGRGSARCDSLGPCLKRQPMKLFASMIALSLISLAGSSAFAIEECRHIKARSERPACYDRQSKTLDEKHKAAGADKARTDTVHQLKIENDRVTKRLKGICRGC